MRLDAPLALARRDDVGARLGEWIVPFSAATPHVTVWVQGFEAGPDHPREGEAGELDIGGANSFLSCPFLEVRSPWIRELRSGVFGAEERWSPYLPHLTVGRYAGAVPTAGVVAALRPMRRARWLPVTGRLVHAAVDAWTEDGDLVEWSAITPAPTR